MSLRTFIWLIDKSATRKTSLRTKTISFGDGYEQNFSEGINNKRKSWNCKCTGYRNEVETIYNFLIEHNGVIPFYMPTIDSGAYITKGDIGLNHVGGDVWSVDFNVQQFFGAL